MTLSSSGQMIVLCSEIQWRGRCPSGATHRSALARVNRVQRSDAGS
jgi:hypothetical protein